MASSDPEIKDGFTLPVWMKSKPTREFEPFAGSPPAPEDSFFYIKYPKTDVLFGKTKLDDVITKTAGDQQKDVGPAVSFNPATDKDWSKHTKPCQDVLHGIAPINTAVNSANLKPKPAGTDDGFKGEGAACGNSIVKVAHQMISSGGGGRGFTVARPAAEDGAGAVAGEAARAPRYDLAARRGSRSLPATPAHSPPSSPRAARKHANRYFTSPFEPVEDSSTRSWLTMALLGFKKDLTTSTSTLAEEEIVENRLHGVNLSLAESVESLGPSPRTEFRAAATSAAEGAHSKPPKPAHAIRPKPSELREMNFWSPTSM